MMPVLLQPGEFLRNDEVSTFKLGLFTGVMGLVFLFNLMCWLVTRKILYGLFAGYVGFGLLSVMDGSGLISSYIWSEWSSLPGRTLSVFLGFTWAFCQAFFCPVLYSQKTVSSGLLATDDGYQHSCH
ncbi:MAG: 7TM diverse intracellular signaling domain-containing protein [Endozoicomonas sp.]